MMEKYLENYKHYIYPISLFLILRKLRDDEISEKISNENEQNMSIEYMKKVKDRLKLVNKPEECKKFCYDVFMEMETFLDMETLKDYIDIVMYELEEKP